MKKMHILNVAGLIVLHCFKNIIIIIIILSCVFQFNSSYFSSLICLSRMVPKKKKILLDFSGVGLFGSMEDGLGT